MAKDIVTESVSANVTETASPVTTEAPVVTKESLMASLQSAMAANDWQSVAKIGASIAKHESTLKRQEREQLEGEVIGLAQDVKDAIESAIEPFLDSPIMEKCTGVWYSWDFGTGVKAIRLLSASAAKTSTKSAGSAGSVGQKFDVKTSDLLAQFGAEPYKETGMTAQEFHESTTDGNKRYVLRSWLLKKGGYTS